jgi:NifB/MoaA-like Fe-S oxidoreductase
MKLKSIKEEANACRKAFKNIAIGSNVVHCHHSELYEKLRENPENRILYILKEKPVNEQALRLRLFRPVKEPVRAEYEKVEGLALAEYEKVEGLALAEYKKVTGLALAEYEKVTGLALAEYKKVKGPALAEYKKVKGLAHKGLICSEPDCPWDGDSIFKS